MIRAAEAREREDWRHTSALLAMASNCGLARDPLADAATPADFDPWASADRAREQKRRAAAGQTPEEPHLPIEVLKWIFVDNQPTH